MAVGDAEIEAGSSKELYAIAPTMYSSDGSVIDTGAMSANAERMASAGISDILLTGAYGEFQALSADERVAIVQAVRDVSGVRSLMACAALPTSTATAQLAERMLDAGADIVMVSPPLLAEVTDTEVLRHFEYLAGRIPACLSIYNNPIFGVDLSPALMATIAEMGSFVAIKQGTKSMAVLAESVRLVHTAANGRVRLLAAADVTASLSLFAGADGLTSTNSWVFPAAIRTVVEAACSRDWDRVRAVADTLEPYFTLARDLGQPRTVKAAMKLRGYAGSDAMRLPYVSLDQQQLGRLEALLHRCDEALTTVTAAVGPTEFVTDETVQPASSR